MFIADLGRHLTQLMSEPLRRLTEVRDRFDDGGDTRDPLLSDDAELSS